MKKKQRGYCFLMAMVQMFPLPLREDYNKGKLTCTTKNKLFLTTKILYSSGQVIPLLTSDKRSVQKSLGSEQQIIFWAFGHFPPQNLVNWIKFNFHFKI